jgi:hypothetical protein
MKRVQSNARLPNAGSTPLPVILDHSVIQYDRKRRRFQCWRMSLSANRIHPRVKPEGMLRRDMRWRGGLPLTAGSGMIAATTNAA